MDKNQKNETTACPECETPIPIPEDKKIGTIVECPACAIDCEVVTINPTTLSPLEEEK